MDNNLNTLASAVYITTDDFLNIYPRLVGETLRAIRTEPEEGRPRGTIIRAGLTPGPSAPAVVGARYKNAPDVPTQTATPGTEGNPTTLRI